MFMNISNNMEFTGYPSIDKPWLKYYDCNNAQPDLKLNLVDYIKQKNCGRENQTASIYYGKKLHIKRCIIKLIMHQKH